MSRPVESLFEAELLLWRGSFFLGPALCGTALFGAGLGSGFGGGFLLGLFRSACADALGIDQPQGVLCVERILPDGGLSGGAEGNVNTPALGQDQGAGIAGKHALLCR